MKIKNFKLNSEDQVITKITGEILRAFHIEIANEFEPVDFETFEIFNEVKGEIVKTRLTVKINGKTKKFSESEKVNPAERLGAEIHRLIKKNLYKILTKDLKLEGVPYGIMHGVRPTKIVHRWLRGGFGITKQGVIDRDKISRRLRADYLTNFEKSKLLTEVAIRQIPILNSGGEKIIGVYVGIPFCVTRCLYCSFPSNVLPADDKVAEFMQVLTKDIDAAAAEIQRYGFKVQSIYIGGGTPTALPEKFFTEMLQKVTAAFYSASVEEFTVECGRPDTITAEKISAMQDCRVSRVSVNPQTMQQKTLDRIGRQHSVEQVYTAFKNLREAGDFEINMDLILGLPGETLSDVKDSLEKVLALNPDDITLHALAIKRGSQLQTQLADEINTLEDFDLPGDSEVRKMGDLAEKMLRAKKYLPYYLYRQGYISGQIENIGYCKRGAESIYNVQIMDERQTILGVGAAATTKVPDNENLRLQTSFNAKDLITYLRDVDKYIENRSNVLAEIYKSLEVAENPAVEPVEISYADAFNLFLEDIISVKKTVETAEISYDDAFNLFLEDIIFAAETLTQAENLETPAETLTQTENLETPAETLTQTENIETPAETLTQAENLESPAETLTQTENLETPAETLTQAENFETPAETLTQAENIETPAETLTQAENIETPAETFTQTENIETLAETFTQTENIETPAETLTQAENLQTPAETLTQAENLQTPAETLAQAENLETPAETLIQTENLETPAETLTQAENLETPAETLTQTENLETPAETLTQTENLETSAEILTQTENPKPPEKKIKRKKKRK